MSGVLAGTTGARNDARAGMIVATTGAQGARHHNRKHDRGASQVWLRSRAEPDVPAIDWKAVRRRLRLIRAALDLPPDYVEEVVASLDRGDETQLIAFAQKHGQSLEWILTGDLVMMLRKFAAWNLSLNCGRSCSCGHFNN